MFKISKLTDYATAVLSLMAQAPEGVYTARDITEKTHINLPTVMKILKLLAKTGLLRSQRGANGGYSFAKLPEAISLIDIIEAIEGDVGLTECSMKESQCALEPICITRHNWQTISHLLYDALGQISLAQMAKSMTTKTVQIELAGKTFKAEIATKQPIGDANRGSE